MGVEDLVVEGRAALDGGRWEDARTAFEAALTSQESPEALDGLAEVRYWQGDYASTIALREQAFPGFRARGETRYPARLAAYHLAFDYAAVHGNLAAANGWLERGRRLAEESGDCPERGWVELACVLATDDLAEKDRHIAAAVEIAKRFGDIDLEFDALAYKGAVLVELGRIPEGMRLLDEAAAAVQGGEVRSQTAAGEIYCKMLLACEMVLDVRRAEQWSEAANALTRRSNVAWASAICRMYYGSILTAAGRWSEAEVELSTSVRIYVGSYPALRGGAVVRLADLRVRQGRLEDAEELLSDHQHDFYAIRPLACLHLVRGDVEVAATELRRHLGQHHDGVLQVPVLALLVEVELAAARPEEAQTVCARLVSIAEGVSVPVISAFAEFAAGLLAASSVDPCAITHFEAALADFGAAGLPLEGARTRVELARQLAATKPDVAVSDATVALAVFDRLGAAPDANVAASLLRSLGARGRTGPKDVGRLSRRESKRCSSSLGSGCPTPR